MKLKEKSQWRIIKLRDDIHTEFKHKATDLRQTVQDTVNQALEEYLTKNNKWKKYIP